MSPCAAALAVIRLRRLWRISVDGDGLTVAEPSLQQIQVGFGEFLACRPANVYRTLPEFAELRRAIPVRVRTI
jgi:hypothetical protein